MEECIHDWHMIHGWQSDFLTDNCRYCHNMPPRLEKWWRMCRLCGRMESFTIGDGDCEHKEEQYGIPI